MRKKKYSVDVVFSYCKTVEVRAEDKYAARDLAEKKASEEFVEDFRLGHIGSEDFWCEAQQP